MAAAAAAQRDGGGGLLAEVAGHLFVHLAPHPPSWYIRQQRAWIAPFAYGGAAAQQAMAAPAEGYRDHHRWASTGIHVSILLVSFCPALIFYLLLAFQRATAKGECAAPEGPVTIVMAGKESTGQEPSSTSSPHGWWAVHWHALCSEDGIQVAISSWGAAASGNAFHSPGTARKNMVVVRRSRGEGERANLEEAEEAKQTEDAPEAEEADPTCGWDGWNGWTRMIRVSDAWQEWYSEYSAHEPDEVDNRDIPRDRWRRRGKPSSAVLDPGDRMLGTTTTTTTTPTTITASADDTLETGSTSVFKTAASERTGRGGSGCDRHRGGEAGGRQWITPGADRGSGKPNGGERGGSSARKRRRGGGGAAKNNAKRAEGEIPRRREGAAGEGEPNTATATSHRSRGITSSGGSYGGGIRRGSGEKEREEEKAGAHPRWSGLGRKTIVGAAAAGGANQEVIAAAGGEGQEVSSRRGNDRGAIGGAGGGTGGRGTNPEESGGSGSDLRTSQTRRRTADDRGGGEEGVPATEGAETVQKGAGAVYRLPYGL